ncbi:universal stress protein [Tropicimonas sp. IMCC6043]|uniref:universal stress protein n=1 Tax=Tropicimonas sp. IMCC6043 TaxID=2510645 RepID=UPI00101B8FA2|nr:universal stress protein [Tropicimonas sp. IMCC6043]RYH06866.1 universal stress protein [Tropicimonas sp. IMCC6043]
MYHKILVPVSFDDDAKIRAALDVARTLAAEDADITLFHVMEHIPAYAMHYMPQDLSEATRGGILEELEKLAEDVPGGHGVLVEGHAGRTILDYASEKGSDCIVIASHRPAMADFLLGSTAAQVVRHADCAVMVVR